jgi:peptidoglycan hydrolase FlgJ
MTIPVSDVRTYGDFAGLDSLKKAAHGNDPAAVREVARQFESLFARMLIKSMRDAIGRDPIFGSDQEEAYQSMFDDQLSLQLTRGHGLGLAEMLVRQLQRRGLSPTGATGNSKGAQGSLTGASAGAGASHSPALAPASKAEQTSFIREVWPQAQQAGSQLGVAPASLVAQAALESDWGRNVPRDANGGSSHNLFGVKAAGSWKGASVSAVTQEFDGTVPRATPAQFRAYSSRTQSFQDYVAVLQSEPRYTQALNTGGDVNAFASALQRGGYATDPDYARKVSAVAANVANVLASGPLEAAAPSSLGGTLKFAATAPMTGETDRL